MRLKVVITIALLTTLVVAIALLAIGCDRPPAGSPNEYYPITLSCGMYAVPVTDISGKRKHCYASTCQGGIACD